MNIIEKKQQLMNIIKQELTSYIDNDYVFFDLPYYNNLGDTLIWEGTKCFLKTLSHTDAYTVLIYIIMSNVNCQKILLYYYKVGEILGICIVSILFLERK